MARGSSAGPDAERLGVTVGVDDVVVAMVTRSCTGQPPSPPILRGTRDGLPDMEPCLFISPRGFVATWVSVEEGRDDRRSVAHVQPRVDSSM